MRVWFFERQWDCMHPRKKRLPPHCNLVIQRLLQKINSGHVWLECYENGRHLSSAHTSENALRALSGLAVCGGCVMTHAAGHHALPWNFSLLTLCHAKHFQVKTSFSMKRIWLRNNSFPSAVTKGKKNAYTQRKVYFPVYQRHNGATLCIVTTGNKIKSGSSLTKWNSLSILSVSQLCR